MCVCVSLHMFEIDHMFISLEFKEWCACVCVCVCVCLCVCVCPRATYEAISQVQSFQHLS